MTDDGTYNTNNIPLRRTLEGLAIEYANAKIDLERAKQHAARCHDKIEKLAIQIKERIGEET